MDITQELTQIPLVDCHEHLRMPSERAREHTGFFEVLQYVWEDLQSAGAPFSPEAPLPLEEKFRIFRAYYPHIQNTAYGKMIPHIFNLYGLDPAALALEDLDARIRANSQTQDHARAWYDAVFKRCGLALALSVHNGILREHPAILPVAYLDFLLRREQIRLVAGRQGGLLPFQDYLAYVDAFLEKQFAEKIVAGKFGTPYWRTLDYGAAAAASPAAAAAEYASGAARMPAFENFLFHRLLARFEAEGLPLQFHTGHVTPQAADLDRYVPAWSNPSPFGPLARQYPGLRFVLLHTGFPFQDIYFSLVKNLPNLYADFSWIYLISPTLAKQALHVALEVLPLTKIIGFGGDVSHVEALYAHLCMARAVLGQVLTEKTAQGWFTPSQARTAAEKLLWDNPREIYGLKI
jgi:hypothetical protein